MSDPWQGFRETAQIAVAVITAMIATAIFSDWAAGRGIFYYHNGSYQKDRTAQSYCERGADVFVDQKPTGSERAGDNYSEADHKKYDSCQQWRSAQAAERSAMYAGWQALGGLLLSFLTLIIAFAAAIYAKQAADHTDKGAQAAVDALHIENRAWINIKWEIDDDPINRHRHQTWNPNSEANLVFHLIVTAHNLGKMPARAYIYGQGVRTDADFSKTLNPNIVRVVDADHTGVVLPGVPYPKRVAVVVPCRNFSITKTRTMPSGERTAKKIEATAILHASYFAYGERVIGLTSTEAIITVDVSTPRNDPNDIYYTSFVEFVDRGGIRIFHAS